jgi:putative oxygen-independent coproporphyrinogen III oxidase
MSGEVALYVHWPFCVSKCPYCDFNSHVAERIDQDRWRRALLTELDHYAAETGGRKLVSIFFGGGTPSLMAPETTAAVIEAARRHWSPADDIEITLEANPSSVEASRFAAYRDAGVNRLSLGVQSFDDKALKFLGRAHDSGAARRAIETAASTFRRFSFDLIYALPDQDETAWRAQLAEALRYARDHLSVYQLTIEPGTPFDRDQVPAAPEVLGEGLYNITQEVLGSAGLDAYEISNHARPGEESLHNLVYWQGGDYVGVGPGAHGRLGLDAIRQTPAPEHWLKLVESQGHGTAHRETLSAEERREEIVMMGLRLKEGLDRARFRERAGIALEDAFDAKRLQRLIDGGFLTLDERGLRTTAEGRLRLNAVIGALLA